ncbi:MAG TPA: serine/threonine-protein kinase [Chitinivibrionales bacterium]|jgi:serine/threonine protein kinase|nr:serine/threonine-protein kinase [Chitinivibrionales bacterium]
MNDANDKIFVRNVTLSNTASPVALPDGKQRIPLGSGVITRLLGQGGMAAVYEIWNSQLEMYRAVKLINPGSSESVRQRFQTEIKITAKLSHPNIVEIHGVGEWNGLPYIEMEKLEGMGLEVLIAERGALPPVVCTAIGIMICRALNYAHNQDCSIYGKNYHGVIHRDLKPANIMICSNGIVKLMDFGIARPADVSFHTMDGLVAGTLQYLAPEQLEKQKLDDTTDIYALGVTMYEIVTGVVAFPQTSFPKLIADKTKNKFKPLEEFHIKLPPRLRRLIYKCMEQAPEKRVHSAAALLDELHKIHALFTNRSPEQIMAAFTAGKGKKTVLATRRRFPLKAVAAVCLAAAAAAGLYVLVWPLAEHSLMSKPAQSAQPAPNAAPARPAIPASPAPSEAAAPEPRQTAAAARTRQTSPGKQPSPAPAAKLSGRETAPPASLLSSLQEKYGTDDNLVIMEKELAARNYQNVLSLYDLLPNNVARAPKALILRMRVFEATGNLGRLAQLLESNSVNDGEFFLEKAKFAFRNQNYAECRRLLALSLTVPHAFIDYDLLRQEVSYYTALCLTAQFDANPTEQTYKDALDAWWQLRNALRSNPDHEYNRKAVSELQRMAKKMQKG